MVCIACHLPCVLAFAIVTAVALRCFCVASHFAGLFFHECQESREAEVEPATKSSSSDLGGGRATKKHGRAVGGARRVHQGNNACGTRDAKRVEAPRHPSEQKQQCCGATSMRPCLLLAQARQVLLQAYRSTHICIFVMIKAVTKKYHYQACSLTSLPR